MTLTEDLKAYLYRLKETCVEHGLTDSFRLPDDVVARLQGQGGGGEDTQTDKGLHASLEEQEEDRQAEQ